jgi:predicted lactoylglutathione lyase
MIVSDDIFVMLLTGARFKTYSEPQDHGFMYSQGFQDGDGHVWELMYMDPSAISQG